jgi:PKD repeat protein
VIRDSFAIIKDSSLLPQTDFDGAPRTGPAPLAVAFTDKTLNGPIAWSWDLDGNASPDSSAQNPSRVYSAPGRYTVSLSATNVAGSQQTTKTAFVCVTAAAPPGAVSGLTFAANRTSLTWGGTALAASYDVVRGNLATLRSTRGSFAMSTTGCLENDGSDQTSSDPATPAAGAGFWYLARASDCAGRPGSYNDGTQSAGRDSGIIAAPSTCP